MHDAAGRGGHKRGRVTERARTRTFSFDGGAGRSAIVCDMHEWLREIPTVILNAFARMSISTLTVDFIIAKTCIVGGRVNQGGILASVKGGVSPHQVLGLDPLKDAPHMLSCIVQVLYPHHPLRQKTA